MSRPTARALFAVCAAMSLPSLAAEFTSPEGFSLKYPDDWVVVSEQEREEVARATKTVLRGAAAAASPAPTVLIRNPQLDEFAENINVVVTPGAVPIDAEAERAYAARTRQQMDLAGWKFANFRCQRTRISDREAISAYQDLTMPGFPHTVRQWQLVVPGAGKTYRVTCSALESQFDQFEPIFSDVVDSLRIEGGAPALGADAPGGDRPGFWSNLPAPVRFAIIGGIIGAIIGAVVGLVRKLFSKPE